MNEHMDGWMDGWMDGSKVVGSELSSVPMHLGVFSRYFVPLKLNSESRELCSSNKVPDCSQI
jgi:hypothetical protein